MTFRSISRYLGGAVLGLLALASPSYADPCLTNASDQVGNSVFGATVGTFTGLGIVAGDGTGGTACIENGLWNNPQGFVLGSYLGGAEGYGAGIDNTVLGSYGGYGGTVAQAANALDFAWVQDTSVGTDADPDPNAFAYGDLPANGIQWDLHGAANQVAVFVFVDHGPVPQEVLENTAWLSNDLTNWTQAFLTHVYGAGFSPDPNISDGFVAVYTAQDPTATFKYVSVTWGGPGAIQRDNDNEIDAVAGLTAAGGGVHSVPEPASLLLLGSGLAAMAARRRRVASRS